MFYLIKWINWMSWIKAFDWINWEAAISFLALIISVTVALFTGYSTKLSNRHAAYDIRQSIYKTTLFIVSCFEDNDSLTIIAEADEVYNFLNKKHYLQKDLRLHVEVIQEKAKEYIRNQRSFEHYQNKLLATTENFERTSSFVQENDATGFEELMTSLHKSIGIYLRTTQNSQNRIEEIESWFNQHTSSAEIKDKFEKLLNLGNF